MFTRTLVLVCCAVLSSCVNVKYLIKYKDHWATVNGSILSSDTLKEPKLHHLRIMSYNEGDPEVDLIVDFPELDTIEMGGFGHDVIPNFEKLPKIRNIQFDKNRIKYVKREAFGNSPVKHINLDNNEIAFIERGAFGTKLQELSLRCNQLDTFSETWFQNVSGLEKINMGGNFLTTIPPFLFKNFINLNSISFSYNNITTIGEGAMANIDRFKFINFAHNRIKEINANVFQEKFTVLNLFIGNNRLTYLHPDLLKKMSINSHIDMDDNPWQCKCWEEIRLWLPKFIKVFKDPQRPSCVVSLSFSDYCVPFVEQELIDHFEANIDPAHYPKDYYCS